MVCDRWIKAPQNQKNSWKSAEIFNLSLKKKKKIFFFFFSKSVTSTKFFLSFLQMKEEKKMKSAAKALIWGFKY